MENEQKPIKERKRPLFEGMPKFCHDTLTRMGMYCSIARKRRNMTQEVAGRQVQVTRQTIARMEAGDPSVSMGAYITYAFVLNVAEDFTLLFSPERDKYGCWLDHKKQLRRQKVRPKQTRGHL
ncbi:MAG: helix-turn-helix transcriptional regulator [Desulfovibrio sp.]|nr:helix-turn-helix transcriptional regulator [Desulfovibrio sp.]